MRPDGEGALASDLKRDKQVNLKESGGVHRAKKERVPVE